MKLRTIISFTVAIAATGSAGAAGIGVRAGPTAWVPILAGVSRRP